MDDWALSTRSGTNEGVLSHGEQVRLEASGVLVVALVESVKATHLKLYFHSQFILGERLVLFFLVGDYFLQIFFKQKNVKFK